MSAAFTLAPSAPDDRAEQAVPLALELVDAVRCARSDDVQSVLDRADVPALLVVLAAMVDDDRPVSQLLGWVEAPGPRRLTRSAGRRRDPELAPCGTHAAHVRHVRRGEPIDRACAQGESDYQHARHLRRRAAAQVTAVPAALPTPIRRTA